MTGITAFHHCNYTIVKSNEEEKSFVLDENDRSSSFNSLFNKFITTFVNDSSLEVDTGILPPGLISVGKKYIVFERRPEFKTVFLIPKQVGEMGDVTKEEVHTFRLPIPWQLYIVQYGITYDENNNLVYYPSNVKMHFMPSSLNSIDQKVFLPTLPNFYSDGSLCRPMFSSMEDITRYPNNISGVIQAAYDWIWNCGTNLDLTETLVQVINQLSHNYKNTILKHADVHWLRSEVNINSFYCGVFGVLRILGSWEKCTLEEVVQFDWPSASRTPSYSRERSIWMCQNILQYLDILNESPYYDLHYDEENDTDFQCTELNTTIPLFENCPCCVPQNQIDMRKMMETMGYNRDSLSFYQSIVEFDSYYSPQKGETIFDDKNSFMKIISMSAQYSI